MKRLLRHMFVYGLGGVISKVINFLLLPLYTHIFSPEQYGALNLVYVLGNIGALLFGLMISSGYARNYFDNVDDSYRESIFDSAFWFVTVSSIVVTIIVFVSANSFAPQLIDTSDASVFVRLISVSVSLQAVNFLFYTRLMVKEKSTKYVSVNVLSLIVTISFTVLFVVYFQWGIPGVLYAQILGQAIEFLVLSLPSFNLSLLKFDWASVSDMLQFSIPLIPIQIAYLVLDLSSRFFIQKYVGLSEVGLFSVGYRIAAILPLFAIKPLTALGPYFFSLIDRPEHCKKQMADFSRYYLLGTIFIVLLISTFSGEIIRLLTRSSYHQSWKVVYFLALGYVLYGLIIITSYGFHITKKTWVTGAFWMFGAFVSLIFNYLLIPNYGMVGAAAATCLSYGIVLIGSLMTLRRLFPVPFAFLRGVLIILSASGVYYLTTLVRSGPIVNVALKMVLLTLWLVLILAARYLTREELSKAKDLSKSLVSQIRQLVFDRNRPVGDVK